MNTHQVWRRHSTWLAALLALTGSGSCSMLYDFSTHQCNTTSDCQKLGSQFKDSICKNEICIAVAPKGGASGTGGSTSLGGATSEGGTDAGGMGFGGTSDGGTTAVGGTAGIAGAAGTSVVPTCSNEACMLEKGGPSWICRNNTCVNLITDDCPVLIPQKTASTLLKKQDVIVVGGYALMDNKANFYESQAIINWDLVFDDFNKASLINGLPGYAGGGTRPLVGLICSTSAASTESITRSMTHLSATAQVPAVLSTMSSNFLYQAWLSQHPDGTATNAPTNALFFMSTGSANLTLANLQDEGLMWHMLGDPRALAAPVVALVKQLEPYVNAQRAANYAMSGYDDPSVDPLRVTLISSDETVVNDIANVLVSPATTTRPGTNLIFNGQPALDNGASFHWKTIQSATQTSTPDVSPAIQELSANPPHIIIAMATSEFTAAGGVLPNVENTWSTVAPGQIRPYYVMSHRLFNSPHIMASLKNFSGMTPPLHERVFGVNYASSQEDRAKQLYAQYLARLKSTYQGTLALDSTENHYDGAYYLLYSIAAAAANVSVPTGSDIYYALKTRIISESTTAASVDVGYDVLSGADTGTGSLAKLFTDRTGYKMALYGTMGAPDFDRFSGTRMSATSAWCLTKVTETTWSYTADGLLFNTSSRNFSPPSTGVAPCLANLCQTTAGAPPACQ